MAGELILIVEDHEKNLKSAHRHGPLMGAQPVRSRSLMVT
jgi:hypothetical protein